MHQLCQREPALLLQQAHLQAGAGRVRQGEDRVDPHHLHRQPGRVTNDDMTA